MVKAAQKISIISFCACLIVNVILFLLPVYAGEYTTESGDIRSIEFNATGRTAVVNDRTVCAVDNDYKQIKVSDGKSSLNFERVSIFNIRLMHSNGKITSYKCGAAVRSQIFMIFVYVCSAMVYFLSPYNERLEKENQEKAIVETKNLTKQNPLP